MMNVWRHVVLVEKKIRFVRLLIARVFSLLFGGNQSVESNTGGAGGSSDLVFHAEERTNYCSLFFL